MNKEDVCWVFFPPTGSKTEDIIINKEDASDQITKSGKFRGTF